MSNYNPLSSNLNPHIHLSNALSASLNNLKKPELRQIGHDLKIHSTFLNLNKSSLVEKIIHTLYASPMSGPFFSRFDLSPFDNLPLLQKILAETLKKVNFPCPPFHGMMPSSLELYAHQPTIIAQPLFRTTTSNFYPEIPQPPQTQAQGQHFPNQHFGSLAQNICLSSSLNCKNGRQSNLTLSCIMPECKRKFHPECLKMPENQVEKEAKIFECPHCSLEKNDPLNEIRNILLPPFIVTPSEQKQFILDHFALKAINEDPSMGIEIKCIKLDYKYLNEQTWLDSGELFLNNRKIQEFKPLQINSALKKRKDEKIFTRENLNSINTIKFLDFKPSFEQKVNVRYEEGAVYMAAVYIVKRLRVDELIAKIQKDNVKDAQSCKNQIMSKFETMNHSHEDCKISIDKVSISLLDTFFDKQMIQTPAKTVFCNHLQCFSLENLIRAMEIAIPRKWRCPICKVKAFDLMIDGYLWNIIKSLGKSVSASEIIFFEDGNYEIIKEDDDSGNEIDEDQAKKSAENEGIKKQEEPPKKLDVFKKNSNKPVEVIVLDEDEETSGDTGARSEAPRGIDENSGEKGSSENKEKSAVLKSPEMREKDGKQNVILPLPESQLIIENQDIQIDLNNASNENQPANESLDKNNNGTNHENPHLEVEISVNIPSTEEQGLNDQISKPNFENEKIAQDQQSMNMEIENQKKSMLLASPKSITSIKSIDNIQKGVNEIQITPIPIDELTYFLKKNEKNLAEIQQNPNIRIYNLEDPQLFSQVFSQKPAEESKEIKLAKRKIELIEQDFKLKIENLNQHRTIQRCLTFEEFKSNQEMSKDDEAPSINLSNNLKPRTFIVKLYKKHFPEISKEMIAKFPTLTPPNPTPLPEPNYASSIPKPIAQASLPNYNLIGNSFEIPNSGIFPLTMFTAGEKGLLGNTSNYLNFPISPHTALNIFDGNGGFNTDFSSQTQVIKNMNNSFLNKTNVPLPNLIKPNPELSLPSKINRNKRTITPNVADIQKTNDLKMKGFEANPICLDD